MKKHLCLISTFSQVLNTPPCVKGWYTAIKLSLPCMYPKRALGINFYPFFEVSYLKDEAKTLEAAAHTDPGA